MWDVAWTDPSRELIGEHRTKRDQDGSETDRSLARQSISTTSSKGSGKSAFSRLRSKTPRQSSSSKGSSRLRTSVSLHLTTPERFSSEFCQIRMSGALGTPSRKSLMEATSNDALWAPKSHKSCTPAADTPKDEISCIKEDEEVSSSASRPPTCFHPKEDDVFGVNGDDTGVLKSKTKTQYAGMSAVHDLQAHNWPALRSPIKRSLVSGSGFSPKSPTSAFKLELEELQDKMPAELVPPVKSPLRSSPRGTSRGISIHNPSNWRKPQDWQLWDADRPEAIFKLELIEGLRPDKTKDGSTGQSPVQPYANLVDQVSQMASAEPDPILGELEKPLIGDVTLDKYQQLTANKRWWMLSVLHHLDQAKPGGPETQYHGQPGLTGVNQQILALHEPRYSAHYLAALRPDSRIHHMSEKPLSSETAPNVRAIYNAKKCSYFFKLDYQFDVVFSMRLPSLCREAEIASLLHNVNRCLKPRGTLHLMLIDPIPSTSALGVEMRRWLTENLLLNLREQSHCLYPSGKIPKLLGDASLRGVGSTLTTTKFYANPQNIHTGWAGDASHNQSKKSRAELRSIVGRMLWREVWGEFVTAKTWWWDDPACVQECLELGTYWEYHSIQAVKAT